MALKEVTDPRLKAQILAASKPMGAPIESMATTTAPDGTISMPMAPERALSNEQAAGSITGTQANTVNTVNDNQADQTGRAVTGGVDSTETENRATGLYIPAMTAAKQIFDTFRKNPKAVTPGFRESAGEWIADTFVPKPFENAVKNMAIPADVREARSALRPLFNAFTQNALYFASGAQTPDPELAKFLEQVQPQYGDTASQTEVKKRQMIARLQGMKAGAGARAGQIDELISQTGSIYDTWTDAEATEQGTVNPDADSTTKPIPAAAAPALRAALEASGIQRGKLTAEQFDKIANGVLDAYDLDPNPETSQQWVDYYNDPSQKLDVQISPPKVGLRQDQQISSQALGSPVGTALAATTNAVGFGALEAMSPKTFDEMSELNPNAAMVGDIAGSIAPGMMLQKGLSKGLSKIDNMPGIVQRVEKALGDKAARTFGDSRKRDLIGDISSNVAYEGLRAGADDDRTVGEGMFNGGLAAVGGRLAQTGVKGFRGDATQKNFDLLQGTDLTVPQRLGLGKTEEILSDFPIVRGNRNTAIEGSNRTFAQKVLADIVPGPGEGPVKLAGAPKAGFDLTKATRVAIDAEYNKIRPQVVGRQTSNFVKNTSTLQASVPAGEATKWYKQELLPVAKVIFDDSGHYDGNSMKAGMRKLWQLEDNLQTKIENGSAEPWAYDMVRTIGSLRSEIRGMVTENSPEVAERLFSIDGAYARYIRMRDATIRAKRSGGVFSPAQQQDSIVKLDPSMGKKASSEGRALDQDYAQAGMEVMGSKGPSESGSFWKIVAAGGLLSVDQAAEAAKPLIAAAGLIGATSYIPGIKRFTKALVDGNRPTSADSVLMRALLKDPKARDLVDDATRQAITQTIANRAGDRTKGDK